MWRWLVHTMAVAALLILIGGFVAISALMYFSKGLPDYKQLADYNPAIVTRLYASDGTLFTEFAAENRVFVPYNAIPKLVVQAFISAEDKNFFSHSGVDFISLFRAAATNVTHIATDRRPVGGSTITQQIAKNFLLTNELSYVRKIREAILAFRIEKAFTKERILELYLNEIYLGQGSYGIASAAVNYFNKSLDELSLPEAAFLAALPKAPNNYNPWRHYETARARRDYVLDRLREDGIITAAQAEAAIKVPLKVRDRESAGGIRAAYFAEEVRRFLQNVYGEEELYKGGLVVRTTLDPKLQRQAERAFYNGIINYDRNHGWRGPVKKLPKLNDWQKELREVENFYPRWRLAVVLGLGKDSAQIGFTNGKQGHIPLSELAWARKNLPGQRVGNPVKKPADVLAVGDVVFVEPLIVKNVETSNFSLQQYPDVNGGLVAIDPHTGRVLAMVGGFSFDGSEFNRATQALRQTGSAIKPFVYLAALENGFTPSSLILDGPVVLEQGPGLPLWKPENYTEDYAGPATLRYGLEQSRNLMTIRLAQALGMPKVVEAIERFHIAKNVPQLWSVALGVQETTLLKLTNAFAIIANGGKDIEPTFLDRIQDRQGATIYRDDKRPCEGCLTNQFDGQDPPVLPDIRPVVVDPLTAYQMTSLMQGVVERGTARRVSAIGKPVAGKTGTTNDSFDAWFIGFSPDLVIGVYVGFDQPRTLGPKETGASVAAPIFTELMTAALKDTPAVPFRIPPGIRLMRVDAKTGRPAIGWESDAIIESFKPGDDPDASTPVLDGAQGPALRGLSGSDTNYNFDGIY